MPEETMLISGLGKRLNINPKTIRYYEEIGLLPEPARNLSGYRIYSDEDTGRLAFIPSTGSGHRLRAKALDFSLEEIGEFIRKAWNVEGLTGELWLGRIVDAKTRPRSSGG